MYSLFLRNIEGFKYIVEKDSYTDKCFRPIELLGNTKEFINNKRRNTKLYQNSKVIINEIDKLKHTKKYHRAGVLLRELEGEGIIFDNKPIEIVLEEDVLSEQISLLWQCMFFNYVLI
ncbi:hypothetical protein [Abyssisolibacter fermentans]|uniref:hypothetical protein n=1 Tax=Abyssisolibacter fermentans TaxID=1766203 RepID=UPI0008362D2D|nr:hypothetical protein [Abyssisolibacter fermentans]